MSEGDVHELGLGVSFHNRAWSSLDGNASIARTNSVSSSTVELFRLESLQSPHQIEDLPNRL